MPPLPGLRPPLSTSVSQSVISRSNCKRAHALRTPRGRNRMSRANLGSFLGLLEYSLIHGRNPRDDPCVQIEEDSAARACLPRVSRSLCFLVATDPQTTRQSRQARLSLHSELVGRLRAGQPARSARPPPLLQPRARSARTPRRSRARARLADHAECLTCAGHVGMDSCREFAPDVGRAVGRAGRRVTGQEVFAHLQGVSVRSQGFARLVSMLFLAQR